jgi:hypothetical protein
MSKFAALLFVISLQHLLLCPTARAQQGEAAKLEIGAEFSSFTLRSPGRVVGVGGRLTYNLTNHLAIEAEGNFFPSGSTGGFAPAGGNVLQGQFGVKTGKRWEKFGIFAKARPGVVSFDGTFTPRQSATMTFNGTPFPVFDFAEIRTTHFSTDFGGVVEVYPSRRVIARFDAGDTIIRFGPRDELDFSRTPAFFRAPSRVTHNFQLSAGVSFRLLMQDENDDASRMSRRRAPASESSAPKFEVGAQLTSVTFNPPSPLVGFPTISGENRPLTETGLGGRFTFNLSDAVGLESEINYFPTADFIATGAGGRILQGQFGVKAGKRFNRFGFFGKARPGFMSFGDSLKLVGTRPFTFDGREILFGIFKNGRRTFFSADLGGVFELYPSRRLMLRFDAGDTIIRYGRRHIETIFLSTPIAQRLPETRHNFQFSTGFGIRF